MGTYELLHRIGSGGMGEVFLACDSGRGASKAPVALKRVLRGLAHREDVRRLFVDEARLTTRMTHRCLVPALDITCARSHGFFTMPFVDGLPLTTLVRSALQRDEALPLGAALAIVQGVATGLHFAHELASADMRSLGVIHCDVSPSNVLINRRGGVHLIDWGIARGSHVTRSLTRLARGTLGYSSPQQCCDGALDRRSDIFSIGILLWELTTMRRLFRGVNKADTMLRVANGDVPRPSTLVEGYCPELEAIVMRTLARDPASRFDTALQLELVLERYASRKGVDLSRRALATWVHSATNPQTLGPRTIVLPPTGSDDSPSPPPRAVVSEARRNERAERKRKRDTAKNKRAPRGDEMATRPRGRRPSRPPPPPPR